MKTVIIGSGPAGVGAGYACQKLGYDFVILEKNRSYGGHSSSHLVEDSIFDEGPHISFTKYPKLRELFHQNAKSQVRRDEAIVYNFFQGKWITHPIMANLGQLDRHEAEIIYDSFESTLTAENCVKETYYEWLISTYGQEACKRFFTPYTIKYWGVHPSEMSTDWVSGRFFAPNPEIVKSGLKTTNQKAHYVQEFFYPLEGGFQSFFNAEQVIEKCVFEEAVVKIDLDKKEILTSKNVNQSYDKLISTVPLPKLIKLLGDFVPKTVIKAAEDLKCSRLHLVSLKVREYSGPRAHWFYVYNTEYFSTRVTLQTAITKGLDFLNSGEVNIQVEFYERADRGIPNNLEEIVISELLEMGLFAPGAVQFSSHKYVEFANVLFDEKRSDNLAKINEYLDEIGIKSVGRFGSWDYLWSDESFLEGVGAVDEFMSTELKGVQNGD